MRKCIFDLLPPLSCYIINKVRPKTENGTAPHVRAALPPPCQQCIGAPLPNGMSVHAVDGTGDGVQIFHDILAAV